MKNTFSDIKKDKLGFLLHNEIPEDAIPYILTGSSYFEQMHGLATTEYWNEKKFSNRDEFFVVVNSYFSLIHLLSKYEPFNEWRGKFDVACLFQMKSNAQSILSIDSLTRKYCYADSFAICRVMISRLSLLILCALNPNLFDVWLKNQKDERFLDGHVRQELKNNGIRVVPHLYEHASEIIHGHSTALTDIGYFEEGLFPEIKAVENEIYVLAKFVIAASYQTVLSMLVQDFAGKQTPEHLRCHIDLLDWFKTSYLLQNRIDHFFTFMAQDRHAEKVGKDKYIIGGAFDYDEISLQIEKFHRIKQKKTLSKKYAV